MRTLVVSAFVLLASMLSSAAGPTVSPNLSAFTNASGRLRTFNVAGAIDVDNPFFQDLGTNGRTCVTCHQPAEAWTITPQGVQQRFASSNGTDPSFVQTMVRTVKASIQSGMIARRLIACSSQRV